MKSVTDFHYVETGIPHYDAMCAEACIQHIGTVVCSDLASSGPAIVELKYHSTVEPWRSNLAIVHHYILIVDRTKPLTKWQRLWRTIKAKVGLKK